MRTKKISGARDAIERIQLPNNLKFYHELDVWQQDNHFIRSAYVKQTSSYAKCIRSLSYLHNESVNIYSHLVPAFLIALVVVLQIKNPAVDHETPTWVGLNFLQFGLGAHICLSLSAAFHLFKSHSPEVCGFGNQCDYFGIVVMITSSLISIIVFAFDDTPKWRNSFIIGFMLLGFVCTILTFDLRFSTPLYRPYRSMMFIFFGLSGVIPVLVGCYIFGLDLAFNRSSAGWLIMEGFFYITGAVLYAARFPERMCYEAGDHKRFSPGKFDLFGHLHQIFHFMVLIAAICHFTALMGCYKSWRLRNDVALF
ncbi:adiponectin receptor [Metschnikowia aff. pulcherrima]|uniref:Adiponectin receptor n=1 Tax=Metschnikowia aff. pulcherrima TaxID=2163413 RepID=A0A4P6XNS1_9ASCO|nr:adiponectin receptor [Metschnikowia aff. pulcherrima]